MAFHKVKDQKTRKNSKDKEIQKLMRKISEPDVSFTKTEWALIIGFVLLSIVIFLFIEDQALLVVQKAFSLISKIFRS
jgi:hypothetical protein